MLGLTDMTSLKYTGSLAVGVATDTTFSGTRRLKVGEPSHLFVENNAVTSANATVELPGFTATDGVLRDGLSYTITNTTSKSSSSGDKLTVTVNEYTSGSASTLITLPECCSITVVYVESLSRYIITSQYNAW